MQNQTFKTLKLIASQNLKKLSLTFSLVMAENGLFLVYPIIAGIAIDAITKGQTMLAMIYALIVFVGWGIGAMRRRVDTQVFTRIYADLAVKVIMNEKAIKKDNSTIIARASLSRELVNFFENHFPVLFTSVISIFGSAVMLLFVEFYVGLAALVLLVILALLLPKYVSKNDHLYLKLNNQIEKEASRITNSDEITLKRHYGLLSMIRVKISNREATSFFIIGIVGALLFGLAIITLSLQNASAGHIYSVLTYLWTLLISLDDAPRLVEEFSKLKDITKRVNVEIGSDTL
ncbi:ABC transporter six-transmembrane domain-containing protein [Campylobacter suis]|uniref:ABC transmembrane type-1 domain-containing protein n=1 Tax=Campylobacter suis TaxID=2790657 RepID=A0ABM8Q6N0_9BACT|nr:ABC transporter six-transmembrane domain-containing protein [Campylobacter suis]CAD7288451.1 hypothetical protein LMG8286_01313 [Campylobacter suis]